MKDEHRNDRDWFDWIYGFDFGNGFLSVCNGRIEHPVIMLDYWRSQQNNMDTFEAEVHLMGLELEANNAIQNV